MTKFYEGGQLSALLENGEQADKSATHHLWIRATEGSQVQVKVGGHSLPPSHTKEPPYHRLSTMSWERVGEVELKKGRRFNLAITEGKAAVGGAVLTASGRFKPQDSFDISHIFLDKPGPVRDERLLDVKDVYTPWTLKSYPTREIWEERAQQIRQRILVAMGLWPLPPKGPLKAQVFGRIEHSDYTVEKVYFESLPGFFVCGNLYRPRGKGPFPGIVSPHGHWQRGRLENSELGSIPGRCINLARQGFVTFAYDMAGYCDSTQVEHRKFGGQREELWGIGMMGIQLWNSIRAVDFLCSLEDVAAARIGCTGASGGGTQAFMLTAVDERIRVTVPVNMVSTHMQGGCLCENQANLRLDINNIEIAALAAPRPLLMVSCTGDWTVDTLEVEYPAVRDIYRLYGAEDRISAVQVDAPHNYNQESREAVYAFLGKWLAGGNGQKRREPAFTVEKDEDLRVFHDRAMPSNALDAQGLVEALSTRTKKGLQAFSPTDGASLKRLQQIIGTALQHSVGAQMPSVEDLYVRNMGRTQRQTYSVQRLQLGRKEMGERVPGLLFLPRPQRKRSTATLVVHPQGKVSLVDQRQGKPGAVVADLLAAGQLVLALDLFMSGEFHSPLQKVERREDLAHFTTYNQTMAACRIQDILSGIKYLLQREDVQKVQLLGLQEAGPWCLLARALAPELGRTAVDYNRFQADQDQTWIDQLYIPGIRAAGGMRSAAALCAPGALLVHNGGKHFPGDWAQAAYRVSGKGRQLQVSEKRQSWAHIKEWLVQS